MDRLELRMGTLAGVSLSMYGQLPLHSITETIALALIGTVVSFAMSRYLQWLFKNKS